VISPWLDGANMQTLWPVACDDAKGLPLPFQRSIKGKQKTKKKLPNLVACLDYDVNSLQVR